MQSVFNYCNKERRKQFEEKNKEIYELRVYNIILIHPLVLFLQHGEL